jgi:hypothetical protein
MKRSHRFTAAGFALALVAAGLALLTSTTAAQQPRAEQWKKVDEAVNKGLPQTAIDLLNPIIESAVKDKQYPEAIKGIAQKIGLEGNIEGNKPEEKIVRMRAAIAASPAEMHPVMNSILAHWYWHYFQQNRWRFTQRTATGEAPGADIQTWDLPRIFAEIEKTFDKALAAEKELRSSGTALCCRRAASRTSTARRSSTSSRSTPSASTPPRNRPAPSPKTCSSWRPTRRSSRRSTRS